jgi:hypothetical protein
MYDLSQNVLLWLMAMGRSEKEVEQEGKEW